MKRLMTVLLTVILLSGCGTAVKETAVVANSVEESTKEAPEELKTDEQEESAKVDASSITISDMGTQGGGEKGMEHRQKWQGSESSSSEAEKSQDMNSMKTEGMSGGDVPAEDTSVGDTTDR